MSSENDETELLGLSSRHEENSGDSVGELGSVSTGGVSVTPLRESGSDLGESFGGRVGSDTVVAGDEDRDSGGRSGAGGSGSFGELERHDGEDLRVEEALRLSATCPLVRLGGKVIHSFSRNIEILRKSSVHLFERVVQSR